MAETTPLRRFTEPTATGRSTSFRRPCSVRMIPLPLELVALLITESDLRSALTARLTMLGFDVVAFGAQQEAEAMPRAMMKSGVLITDNDDIGLACYETQPWLEVIILDGSSANPDGRPLRLPRRGATRSIAAILEHWRAAKPPE